MAGRRSRRLQGLAPEIKHTQFRCFCLVKGDTSDSGVIQLPCCRQFLHRTCYQQWRQGNHTTFPMCRYEQHQPAVPALPLPRMNNQKVIE